MKFGKVFASVVLIGVVGAALFVSFSMHASAKDVGVPLAVHATAASAKDTANGRLVSVVGDMNTAIAAGPDNLSVSVTLVDLDTGQTYNAGASSTVFKAASTAKVLTAVDYLHEVEEGHTSLGEVIDGETAKDLIQRMVEVSDNDAWGDLENFLGDQQQTYATSIGMTNFTAGDYHTMTTTDEAVLLTKLYEGKLIDTSDRTLLYSYMANTDSTNLIQAVLPSSATVYHKYGQLWGDLNDAAIVRYQGHDFVLVIFTDNSDGTTDEYEDQVSLIHAITTAAFTDVMKS